MNKKINRGIFVFLLMCCIVFSNTEGSSLIVIGAETADTFVRTTNQEKVFTYLTSKMKLNAAAACGIMANIERESGFNPTASGGGGRYYGICQWGNSRKTTLIEYCQSRGLDYTSLEGQLEFLNHELTGSYGKVNDYMKSVANTSQGAYDAGYYWCYHFERPGNIEATSAKRGELARDKYWPVYEGYQILPFVSYIDSPKSGETYSRVISIRGWALYGGGITKVTAKVNGNVLDCEFAARPDVLAAYPEYEEENAGFAANIPSAYLNDGNNEIQLLAYCQGQEFQIGTVTFVCENIDRTAPVISEVSVLDVTEYGYTVSCKVQDDSGLLKVQFPTWTDANGQDDLLAGWQTSETASGTIEGEMVTYRVPISSHNYESGKYITHIYAYDLAGNVTMSGVNCQVPEGAIIYGDVDDNKKVDAADALSVLKAVVHLEMLDEAQQKKANVSGDSKVEAADALLILQHTVQLIKQFPVE